MNNQLVKQNNSLSPIAAAQNILNNLLPEAKKMMVAALQPKIKDLAPIEVVDSFTAIITGAFTIAGQQPEQMTLAIYTDEFYTKLYEVYPAITIDEVRAALRNGVYGEYGEYFGLNPKTFIHFVKSYLFSESRRDALAMYENKKLLLSDPVLTEDQKDESNREFVNHLYKNFLSDSLISDYIPGYLFNFIEKKGLVKLSNDEKKDIKRRADEYHTRLLSANYNAIKMALLSASLTMNTDNIEVTRRNIAKQFAVYDFFAAQKVLGITVIFSVPLSIENV